MPVYLLPLPPSSETPKISNIFNLSADSGYQCCESDWEGLNARPLFLALKQSNLDKLEKLLSLQTKTTTTTTTTTMAGDSSQKSQQQQQKQQQKCPYTVNDLDGDLAGLLHVYALNAKDDIQYNRKLVDIIIKADGDIDLLHGKFKETPLLMAVKYSKSSFVQALLERDARMDICDIWGDLPIASARSICSTMHNNNHGSSKYERPCCKTLKLLENEQRNEARQIKLRGRMERAEALRIQGNNAIVKNGDGVAHFVEAREFYTESLAIYEDYRAYSNRALCNIKIGQAWIKEVLEKEGNGENNDQSNIVYPRNEAKGWGEAAVSDAGRAARLEPTFSKAHYRKVMGHILWRDFPRAKNDARDGLDHCPTDRHLRRLYKTLDMWKVPNCISNPYSEESEEMTERINRRQEPTICCRFCLGALPISMLTGPNESTCIRCVMNDEDSAHVTEEMIIDLILNH